MELKRKKCSFSEHHGIDAINYCGRCKIYLCNKCDIFHSKLFLNHHVIILDKENEDIFTGFCKEEKHQMELEYFCKNHNQLCCAACLCKINNNGNGKHKDCEVYCLDEIKNEKINKLKENIKFIEELSNNLEESLENLKINFNKINNHKDELKGNIQKLFTKIRNEINNREDEILLEVDRQYEKLYFNEEIIKEGEKLPNKIKLSLEKSKVIEKEEENNNKNTSLIINECINIEKIIKDIKKIKENTNKYNDTTNVKIKFFPENEYEINKFLENIKNFGNIKNIYDIFKFKKCPIGVNENRKYIVSGENQNIITKIGTNSQWMGTICENELEKDKENIWKIKILKTQSKGISIGVAPIDFDINSSTDTTCGWYLYCSGPTLYSGPPHNYNGKNANLKSVKDEIKVVMDMNKRTLKFIIDGEDKEISYINIPIDKPLFPAVCLYNTNDSVEIIKCK